MEYYLTPDFEEIKGLSPEQFVRSIVENCHAKALFCGENFTFGAKAAGTPELLRKLCAPLGVEVVVVPMAQFEEKPVSSTRIRTALEGGDIPAANAMLGMPYAIRFAVQHGAGLGHTLEEILAAKEQGPAALEALMLPVESVFIPLPLLVVEPWVEQHLYNGCPTSRYPAADGRYRVRNAQGQFLGLANITGGVLRVEKLFVERN